MAAASPSVLAALDVLAQAVAGNRSPSAWAVAAAAAEPAARSPAPPAPVVTVIPPPRAATRATKKTPGGKSATPAFAQDIDVAVAVAPAPSRADTRKAKSVAPPPTDTPDVAKAPVEASVDPAGSIAKSLAPVVPEMSVAADPPMSEVRASDAPSSGEPVPTPPPTSIDAVAIDGTEPARDTLPPAADQTATLLEATVDAANSGERAPTTGVSPTEAAVSTLPAAVHVVADPEPTPSPRGRGRAKGRGNARPMSRPSEWAVDLAEAPQPDIRGGADMAATARFDDPATAIDYTLPARAAASDIAPTLAAAYPEIVASADGLDASESADRRRWLETLELYRAAKGGRLVVNHDPQPPSGASRHNHLVGAD